MLSVEECRKHLGQSATGMSDEKVIEIRDSLYGMAELALDVYIERCNTRVNMNLEKPKSKQPIPDHAKLVFKGAIFDVYQWEQELYNGSKATFEKLKRPDTVLIIPVTEDGKIIMSYQEQPGKAPFTGTIGGRVDEGEDALEAAKRELLEESGYEAKEWKLLDAFQPVSKIEWAIYVLVAKGCKKIAEQSLDGGEKIELKLVDFDEFVEMVLDGKFGDMEMRVRFLEAKLAPSKMAELRKMIME